MEANYETQQMSMNFKLYAVLVANSILMYDHIMTLTEEIAFIWCRPKALSSILFLLNRYVALLGNIYASLFYFLHISSSRFKLWFLAVGLFCSTKFQLSEIFAIQETVHFCQQIFICLILTLRTYALYGRSQSLLTWMIIIVLALAGLTFAGTFGHYPSTANFLAGVYCYESYTETVIPHGMTWMALCFYESLIFVLTVSRICKTRGLMRLSLVMSRRNIIDIIFQDGAMYFAAITLINLPNILTYYCGPDIARGSLATFTNCMSVTLVSRLVLNLHKSIDTGILPIFIQDDDHGSAVLTTRVNVQSAISSHYC
ncbi:hypothetical protein DEU56DRAFT_586503 [Suillus clintonianus]|uniref:uncharacterized protein n=1 Tax=Suillus clintonianus TaxID=1904413 RepID=UPI001B8735D5|nr:uncharacterized protein DEU56DRAFT_586503 [Suillus clintonianus]KAG2125040.1 hypothetical protein DEU56DRAFT_586503 [Suillus clintonianus]